MLIGFSKLKYDLCCNLRVIDESSCDCGEEYDAWYHYFTESLNYTDLRQKLFNLIAPFTNVNIPTILYGSQKLGINNCVAIIDALHNYMMKSERFQ